VPAARIESVSQAVPGVHCHWPRIAVQNSAARSYRGAKCELIGNVADV